MASAGHLVSGRARLQGKQTGVLSFNAPDKAGAYQLRMFDAGSGKEIASYNFTAGSDAYLLSGIYLEQRRDNKKYFIKIEVYDNGSSARFLSRDYKDSTRWVEYLTGKVVGNTIFYMDEIGCWYGPDRRTAGEHRDVPFRMVFTNNFNNVKQQPYKVNCDSKGKMTVLPQWDERQYSVTYFIRVK